MIRRLACRTAGTRAGLYAIIAELALLKRRNPRHCARAMLSDPYLYLVAIPAVVLLGLGKGGFAGVGSIALPLVALVISPVKGAAILLPLMIVQDAVGVWAFRRSWDGWILAVMLPGAAVGTFLGYLMARHVATDAVMLVLGLISILFAAQRLWIDRHGPITAGAKSPGWVGTLFGVASGFTSQIALAGGPPFQMWVLPRRLPREILVGTTAIFFALINWMKIPAFAALDQFTLENLAVTAVLLPVAILSTLAGVWLVRRIDAARFYRLIYLLMILVGLRLAWVALVG